MSRFGYYVQEARDMERAARGDLPDRLGSKVTVSARIADSGFLGYEITYRGQVVYRGKSVTWARRKIRALIDELLAIEETRKPE